MRTRWDIPRTFSVSYRPVSFIFLPTRDQGLYPGPREVYQYQVRAGEAAKFDKLEHWQLIQCSSQKKKEKEKTRQKKSTPHVRFGSIWTLLTPLLSTPIRCHAIQQTWALTTPFMSKTKKEGKGKMTKKKYTSCSIWANLDIELSFRVHPNKVSSAVSFLFSSFPLFNFMLWFLFIQCLTSYHCDSPSCFYFSFLSFPSLTIWDSRKESLISCSSPRDPWRHGIPPMYKHSAAQKDKKKKGEKGSLLISCSSPRDPRKDMVFRHVQTLVEGLLLLLLSSCSSPRDPRKTWYSLIMFFTKWSLKTWYFISSWDEIPCL